MIAEKNLLKNRREYRRYPISATALFKVKKEKDTVQFETSISNISQSGLGVYSYVPIDEGTSVSIEITFIAINGFEQKDTLEGRVIHSSKLGGIYYTSVAFNQELNPVTQPFLYNHFWKIINWG
ncbi:MAG: PilZ domain-containing protein [Nitrospirae bacterium]|nr:PilZ domain-containing protein [Nitrospirota bacterium]